MSSERNPTMITPSRASRIRIRSSSSPSPLRSFKRRPPRRRLDTPPRDDDPPSLSDCYPGWELFQLIRHSNPDVYVDEVATGPTRMRVELLDEPPIEETPFGLLMRMQRDIIIWMLEDLGAARLASMISLTLVNRRENECPTAFLLPLMTTLAPHLCHLSMEFPTDSLYMDRTLVFPQLESCTILLNAGRASPYRSSRGIFDLIDLVKAPALRRLEVGTPKPKDPGQMPEAAVSIPPEEAAVSIPEEAAAAEEEEEEEEEEEAVPIRPEAAVPIPLKLADLPTSLLGQLTVFDAIRIKITPSEVLRILESCPLLEECSFADVLYAIHDPWLQPRKPVPALKLCQLTLRVGEEFPREQFLGSLTAPCLSRVRISTIADSPNPDTEGEHASEEGALHQFVDEPIRGRV
ncbi:hypothetical protein C8R46DRAFT_1356474 [Mycena filopes]|nr:hypothetical protein C8R46DRAFT_1356474 [Mycena filopes]